MGYLRLFWRLVRFLTVQLPVIAVLALAALAILENLGLLSREGLLAIAMAAAVAVLAGVLIITPLRRAPNSHGTARFAAPREIRKAGLFRRGLIIGKLKGLFLRFDRPGHLLTFAPTRSGKEGASPPDGQNSNPGSRSRWIKVSATASPYAARLDG
jgi:Type IV secretory pathway, VirD4 components